jgi:hypothetical protein
VFGYDTFNDKRANNHQSGSDPVLGPTPSFSPARRDHHPSFLPDST